MKKIENQAENLENNGDRIWVFMLLLRAILLSKREDKRKEEFRANRGLAADVKCPIGIMNIKDDEL